VVSDSWVCKVGWLCLEGSSGVVGGWCGGFCEDVLWWMDNVPDPEIEHDVVVEHFQK
jgi:hypothetical protein